MQLANVTMKSNRSNLIVHYCLLILEMETFGKDIVDNNINLPVRTSIVKENYSPVAKYKKAGPFYHLCSAAVVWTSAALVQLAAVV